MWALADSVRRRSAVDHCPAPAYHAHPSPLPTTACDRPLPTTALPLPSHFPPLPAAIDHCTTTAQPLTDNRAYDRLPLSATTHHCPTTTQLLPTTAHHAHHQLPPVYHGLSLSTTHHCAPLPSTYCSYHAHQCLPLPTRLCTRPHTVYHRHCSQLFTTGPSPSTCYHRLPLLPLRQRWAETGSLNSGRQY